MTVMKSKNIIIVLLSFIGGVYVQADNLFERNPHWRLEDMEAHWKGRWYDVGDPEEVNGKFILNSFICWTNVSRTDYKDRQTFIDRIRF